MQLSIPVYQTPISSSPLVKFLFHTLYPFIWPYRSLRSLMTCVVLLSPLVLIRWGISIYKSKSILAWVKSRKKSTWYILHPLVIESNSTILMVNQFTTGENVSKKFEVYTCLLLWRLRHAFWLNTLLVLMYLLCFNAHTYGRSCPPFGTCSLGISYQCIFLMWAFNSWIITFWNSLLLNGFMAWW